MDRREKIARLAQTKEDEVLLATDKTPAEEIAARFGVSKKTFKQALGTLYKAQRIRLLPDGIALL